MPAADAERQAFLCCYLALRMDLIEVVTGILPHLVTESNNNLCLGGGALNYAMQKLSPCGKKCLTNRSEKGNLGVSQQTIKLCLVHRLLQRTGK